MSYPKPGWPPPPPHAYGGPGPRPWVPYGVPPPYPYAAYAHPTKPSEPPKDDYWDTELKENPLGLENMHIRANSQQKERGYTTSGSSSTRVPLSASYSRASDYANRNSYPPNAGTRALHVPSSSHPDTRVPSHTRHCEHEREGGVDVIAPSARHASHPDPRLTDATLNGNVSSNQPSSVYQRPPSRSYSGRTSAPVEAGARYSSASASASAHAAQMATRSHTLPGASHHGNASAATSGHGMPRAQGMQRSMTLPDEVRERTITDPVSRRSSDRHNYRYPKSDHDESEEEAEEDGRISPSWAYVKVDKEMKGKGKVENKSTDRVLGWIDDTQRTALPHHDSEQSLDRERERGRHRKEKLRSKSYHHAPAEDDYDGYGDEHTYNVPGGSASEYGREKRRGREGIVRHTSAPNPTYASAATSNRDPDKHASYTGLGTSTVTEEPEDMHEYYVPRQPLQDHAQYANPRRSPYRGREQDYSYRENKYSSSTSSSSDSNDEGDDEYNRPPHSRQTSTRARGQKSLGTPHPAALRRFPDGNDTLRVDDPGDTGMATQGNVHLPSPRSLRQSSRTPSGRPSYEHVSTERERGHERSNLSTGISSASAAAAARGYGYGTPPVTPTRQDQVHHTDSTRKSYATQPTSLSSASAASLAANVEPAHTPARLAYLYRGSGASPSPSANRTASTQPALQSYAYSSQHPQTKSYSQSLGGQYASTGYSETKPKKRSPHASRPPSPLPPGQKTSSSSMYYAAPGQLSTAAPPRSRSRSHDHSHSRSHVSTQGTPQEPTSGYDGRRRNSSRAPVSGSGYSSASGAAAAIPSSTSASVNQVGGGDARHVRAGYWNRRGDHLTEMGYVVYCPPGRCYPRDLADYPDTAFKDHLGDVIYKTPDSCPELPESVPRSAGRAPERNYDSFVKYVLIGNNS